MGILALVAGAAGAAWEVREQHAFALAGHRPPGELVDIGGRRLHLVCAGKGEPGVMLVSGLGESFTTWGSFRDSIARFSRVCAYDRAGIGWSDPADTPRTADAAARDLGALLAAARPFDEPPVLVGHSIGGLYAHRYARTDSGNVAGLVLIDPTTEELYDAAADWRSDALYRFVWPALGRLGVLRLRFRHAHRGLDPDSLDRLAGAASGYPAARAVAREYAGLAESFAKPGHGVDGSPGEAAMVVEAPIIVLSARRSTDFISADHEGRRSVRRSSHARLAGAAADGRMIEVDGGHYMFRERPDAVAAVIRSLVERSRIEAERAGLSDE
jgi:pimeloyl-ACP methyl ester carboxylesterase